MPDPALPSPLPFPHRGIRYLLSWSLAIGFAVGLIMHARFAYDEEKPVGDPGRRVDGNWGHTAIDFAGQWMMGRMLVRGHGTELYLRYVQWGVAEQGFPRVREAPTAREHDADRLLSWFMGQDHPRWRSVFAACIVPLAGPDSVSSAAALLAGNAEWNPTVVDALLKSHTPPGVGGPLYPPLHAFVMAPFAFSDDPQCAYFTMQWLQLALAFMSGLGVSWMTRRRIWWPVATALILAYPGFRGTIDLGQNSATTLCLLLWGWGCVVHKRPVVGGILWGFLAYKPVWALSFFLALLLLRQWRAALAMAVSGALLVLATIPFVGLQSWLDWLYVGQQAAAKYNVDLNWIGLSRDLFGIPRRFFIDFSLPPSQRDNPLATAISWALWLVVLELTIRVLSARKKSPIPTTGIVPAFVFFASWMCTYRFMYYDALVSAFGVFVLVAALPSSTKPISLAPQPKGTRKRTIINSFPLTMVAALLLIENVLIPASIEMTAELGPSAAEPPKEGREQKPKPRLVLGTGDRYPCDTVCVLLLWIWCGGRVLMERERDPHLLQVNTT